MLIARDVLSANGTAADAAVALYFALAVTMPSTAALGGGGVCVLHDAESKRTEALDFLPRAAPEGRVALPGNVRGMAALHARYGRLRWEQLLGPAENLARFGTPASRALAREISTAGERLLRDPELAALFATAEGRLIDEGDNLRQPALANALSQIRQKGAGEFYTGALARNLAEAAQSIGAPLTIEALRETLPAFRETLRVPYGNHLLHFAPPPPAGGVLAAQMIGALTEGRSYRSAGAEERPHLLAEASMRAFADRARWMQPDGLSRDAPADLVAPARLAALMEGYRGDRATPAATLRPPPVARPENPWATGFVIVDRAGDAVACNVTMNELFGAARMAPGTGILLAPAPNARGAGPDSLGPMILSNPPTGAVYYAAAASGGPTAATALATVFLRAVVDEQPLPEAVRTPRIHHNGEPDIVFHEAAEVPATLEALTARGHRLGEAGIIGRVNAIACAGGVPSRPETCQAAADPRANGLATLLSD